MKTPASTPISADTAAVIAIASAVAVAALYSDEQSRDDHGKWDGGGGGGAGGAGGASKAPASNASGDSPRSATDVKGLDYAFDRDVAAKAVWSDLAPLIPVQDRIGGRFNKMVRAGVEGAVEERGDRHGWNQTQRDAAIQQSYLKSLTYGKTEPKFDAEKSFKYDAKDGKNPYLMTPAEREENIQNYQRIDHSQSPRSPQERKAAAASAIQRIHELVRVAMLQTLRQANAK